MSAPPRRRVPVAGQSAPAPERRGVVRIAAILGVLVGIPAGIFGLPALLGLFFGEPTIPFGGAWTEDGLTIWVESVEVEEGPPRAATVTLSVRTAERWTATPAAARLELTEGDPVAADPSGEPPTLEAGASGTLRLRFFLLGAPAEAEPRALRLGEPNVRFALTEAEE